MNAKKGSAEMLDKQIQIYSCDTGHFYSKEESRLHWLNHKLRIERNQLVNGYSFKDRTIIGIKEIAEKMKSYGVADADFNSICKGEYDFSAHGYDCQDVSCLAKRYIYRKNLIAMKNKKIKEVKDSLLLLLSNKVEKNIESNGTHHIRELDESKISEKNVISVFDSYFTRTIGAEPDELCEDFMVIQVYYFDVIKDLIYHGFMYKGEKYIYFTSSAGQIRTKKTVFVKESVWKKYEKSIMCGLTIDDINAKGGNNPNKHLAYLALANSATDVWEEFDIDKTIVIDDFETDVYGEYDLVDDSDYSVTRTSGNVPIPHTDGAGMMLPCMGKNRMVRLPWVKGLLGVFDYAKFIEEHGCSPVIKDIYGKEHDVIAEDIQVIFTKSQFKMWKYYESWDKYKEMYKKYGCTAGITNVEESKISDATINYQMLQSLTDIDDGEIMKLTKKSRDRLNKICSSVEDVKNVFGATKDNTNRTALQDAIMLYPEIINDVYIRQKLKEIKDSMIKNYKSGKLRVNGKYTFILPDFYAACQHWFMGIENPNGLLADGDVYCKLFSGAEEVDCLRSPHLFLEHAIRRNTACRKLNVENKEKLKKWFCTNAVYTSCKDMISRILQFDVDGDKALVVADDIIIEVAKRNIERFDIVPLYYNMKKASAAPLSNVAIYNGLHAAFVGGNIGIYSNNISKIWNSETFTTGTIEEQKKAVDLIKLLCMENNFVIDYAKTLYKPTRPKDADAEIVEYTKGLLPHFFKYAKDKDDGQVEKQVDYDRRSMVNKFDDDSIIPNPRITFRLTQSNGGTKRLGKPDYRLMMSDPDIDVMDNPVVLKYIEKASMYGQKVSNASIPDMPIEFMSKTQLRKDASYKSIVNEVRKELAQFGNSDDEISDILVKYLYHVKNSKRKDLLWACYGDVIYKHLYDNLLTGNDHNAMKRSMKRVSASKSKTIRCVDCGKWFEVGNFDSATCRCDDCYSRYRRQYKALKEKERRNKMRGQTL